MEFKKNRRNLGKIYEINKISNNNFLFFLNKERWRINKEDLLVDIECIDADKSLDDIFDDLEIYFHKEAIEMEKMFILN